MTTLLPPRLRDRLDTLAGRVRHLRRLRGISLVVLALVLAAAVAILADLVGALPPLVRMVDLALWVLLGAGVAFVCLIRPSRRRIDPADLAAVVERHYPNLEERLTSSVELSSADVPAGPSGFVARLLRETDEQTQPLDFDAAVPAQSARRLCTVASLVVAVSLLPAAFAPGAYGQLLARFFLPWRSQADFTFVIRPGDTIAARGRPLTVRATLVPRDPEIALPRYCTLVLEQESETTRLDLVAEEDDPSTYRATFPVVASGRYHVVATRSVSARHTLTAVTPTDLAADSPTIVVTPPTRAALFAETQTLTGMVDVSAYLGSDIAFRFAFDRPATAAALEWTPEGKPTQSIPLPLLDEGRSATWSVQGTQAGAYRLVITGERQFQTVREGGRITLRPLPESESSPMPPEMTKTDAEAKERLDDLANRQKELADRAAGAKTKEEADDIAKAQAELARELDRLAREEATLKSAVESALADRAKSLAEDQRDLARASEETERKQDAESLAELAKHQRLLQQKIEALAKETATPTRANFARPLGDDATKAMESMTRGDTQKALDEQDRAARDLDRLARDLARLAEAAKDPREAVRQLSRLQEDLARRVRAEAERTDDQPLADRLKDLLREQEALRQAVRDLDLANKKADERQSAAEKALARGDTKEALAQMESARLALRESANKMTADDKTGKASPLLPSDEKARQARELAAEQRALRQETKDKMAEARRAPASTDKEPPTAKLARDQAEIARQAAKLAPQVEQEQGAKSSPASRAAEAKRSTGDAARDMERGSLETAKQSGDDAAKALRQLADDLAKATRTPGHDTLEKARKLATRQEELNRLLSATAKDPSAQRGQQQARQEELTRRAGELGKELDKMPAAKDARQAEAAMKAAQAMAKQGNQTGSQAQREQAAKALEKVARMGSQPGQGSAGQAVQEAREQMGRAQGQLGKGEPQGASGAMQQAAADLRLAGKQLARGGAAPGGTVDSRMLPKALTPYLGKRWGDLPGDLQTRLVQQMKARYGDDYARSIKLYFEQLADTRQRP